MNKDLNIAGWPVLGLLSLTIACDLHGQTLEHAEPALEEIIVTSGLHRSSAETVLPVNVLGGEELREKAAATLGEMLQEQVGVNNASFGVGVGLPVIRGQSANRVQILQGGVGNLDASSVSADHSNSMEPALAERIEVVRGPSTLLYGNGAIGGVVNVIDNRIPTEMQTGISALLESRYNNVADNLTTVLKLEGGSEVFAWHVDAIDRQSNDTRINGFAINPDQVDLTDAESYEKLLESRGKISNSSTSSDSQTIGGSWLLENGYVGMAFNRVENEYGLPPGEEGNIRIVMEQDRLDFETNLSMSGIFSELHGKVSTVDYQHVELEEDGTVGTKYSNEGEEGRFLIHLSEVSDREGVLGLQFGRRQFSALGEEAFIPKTDIDSLALFTIHSIVRGDFTHEAGLRAEYQKLDQLGSCDHSSTNYSGSLASIWHFREDINLTFAANHSQRSATVEERYSNVDTACNVVAAENLVEHAATQRFEIGDPRANKEQSTNFELGIRKYVGDVRAEFNLFYNDISDYIYLSDTGEFMDDLEIAQYLQEDAVFKGLEAEVSFPLYRTGQHLSELALFTDYVRAEFHHSGNVPRIPPLRYGIEWTHSHVNWMIKLRWAKVAKQSDRAIGESITNGYQSVSLYADYHMDLGESASLFLFAKGNNLLDERIRNHVSLVKDVAPAPGRGVEVGLRLEF